MARLHCTEAFVQQAEIAILANSWLLAAAAEHSSSTGLLVQDDLQLANSGVPIVFGCETEETGEIYNQVADGLMGLGNSEISVVNQVSAHSCFNVAVSVLGLTSSGCTGHGLSG